MPSFNLNSLNCTIVNSISIQFEIDMACALERFFVHELFLSSTVTVPVPLVTSSTINVCKSFAGRFKIFL